MVTSRGPGWVVVGATLVVVVAFVVDVVDVDIVVEVSGAIEASALTTLDETEVFEFCSSLHANKRVTPRSGRRNLDFTHNITKYHTTSDQIIRRRDLDPWPTSP